MNTARPLVVIQARLGSSRLPAKILLKAGGLSVLEHLVRRVRRSGHHPTIAIATTEHAADDQLEELAVELGTMCVRGPVDDVLRRFAQCVAARNETTIVRLTADCPLLDPDELDRVIDEFLARQATAREVDYVRNASATDRRIPHGQDVEVMSREALLRADREATDPGDREHVTPYLYRNPNQFRTLVSHRPGANWSRYRLTVDTKADYDLVRELVEALGVEASLDEIGSWLDAHPTVAAINRNVAQKSFESESEIRRRRIAGRPLLARADGGKDVGAGHLARVEALLDSWVELGGRGILMARGVSDGQAGRLASAGIAVQPPQIDTPAELLALARKLQVAGLVIDGYAFDADYHRELILEFPLVAIDDLAAFPPVAPVVVNPNIGASPACYGTTASALLLGADYVLLRRGLREAVSAVTGPSSEDVVGVSFGGTDPKALSADTARAVATALPDHQVWVVGGAHISAQQRTELELLTAENPRVSVLRDVARVEAVWPRLSVLVTAAGTTAYEALALGVPCVATPTVENQRIVANGLSMVQGAIVVDPPDPLHLAEQAAALARDREARSCLSRRGRQLIDGRGTIRVIDALLDLVDSQGSKP